MKEKQKKGRCERCGRCCTFKSLWDSLNFKDKIIYGIIIFIKTKKLPNKKISCPKLIYDKTGMAKCADYEHRPDFCRLYPNVPSDLIGGCGYYFDDALEDIIKLFNPLS